MIVPVALLLLGVLQAAEPVDPVALEWFHKGEELIGTAQENSPQQARYFEEAVALAPDFAVARYNLALVYIKQDRPQMAVQQLDALIELDATDPRGYLLRARLRFEANELDPAASDLTRALEFDSENYQAWQFMGRIHYQKQQYGEAVGAFETVLKLNSSLLEAFLDLALSQQAAGRNEDAIGSYRKFLIAFPDDFQGHFLLGLAYRDEDQADLALEQLQIAERIDPGHNELSQELGYLLLDRGDLEEAKTRLIRAPRPISGTWVSSQRGRVTLPRRKTISEEDWTRSRITRLCGFNSEMFFRRSKRRGKRLRPTRRLWAITPGISARCSTWERSCSILTR